MMTIAEFTNGRPRVSRAVTLMRSARFIAGWIGAAVITNAITVSAVSVFAAESLVALFAVALIEGTCLGLMQRSLIRGLSTGVRSWIPATIAGVVAGRIVQYVLETGPWMPQIYGWPQAGQLAAGACAGLAVGAIMALPQVRALSRDIRRTGAWMWVVARAVSTAAAYVVLGLAQFMLGVPAIPFAEIFCLLLLIAATAGAVGAAIEAPVMARLLTSQR